MELDKDITGRFYPEKAAGGFTSVDGTVEFYSRVNALITPDSSVLDFGAGRAAWLDEEQSGWKRRLRLLRGKGRRVVACDIDPIVRENPTADETIVIEPRSTLPFKDGEFQLIVADFVFEHLDDPTTTVNELIRVLAPGGWLCARTPNRRGYVSLITRVVPNTRHNSVLTRAQPTREQRDVFPTRFLLNTMAAINRAFPNDRFTNGSYFFEPEPAYHFNQPALFGLMKGVNAILPKGLRSSLFVFVQKKPRQTGQAT